MMSQRVLVAPRVDAVPDWVSGWPSLAELTELGKKTAWMPRNRAELSDDWIQPIPCAVLQDYQGRYCLLRRKRRTSEGIRGRLSLVVGGHVDWAAEPLDIELCLVESLKRELKEEIGLEDPDVITPMGVVADLHSTRASRHVAFVYQATVGETLDLTVLASEEFALRSKYNLQFLSMSQLKRFNRQFDPWSSIILNHLLPDVPFEVPLQRSLL